MEAMTSVSKTPQPRPWTIRAPMQEPYPGCGVAFHTHPINVASVAARYTGRLPQSFAATDPTSPLTADAASGTPVRAVTAAYDTL